MSRNRHSSHWVHTEVRAGYLATALDAPAYDVTPCTHLNLNDHKAPALAAPPKVNHGLTAVAKKACINNATALALANGGGFVNCTDKNRAGTAQAARKCQICDHVMMMLLNEFSWHSLPH